MISAILMKECGNKFFSFGSEYIECALLEYAHNVFIKGIANVLNEAASAVILSFS